MLAVAAVMAVAQTPDGVLDLFRTAAQALADQDVPRFIEQFDPEMKNLDVLRQRVTLLVAAEGAESSIEVVRDEGDDKRRQLEIDWLLRVGTGTSKRKILKLTVERRGRGWKVTALDAVEFFSRDATGL
jgi:hypothetical protein